MKPAVIILGLISILWLLFGTAFMSNRLCPASTNTFNITDEGGFKASSSDMFLSLMSSDELSYGEDTRLAFVKVVKYLDKNPDRQLNLTGLFSRNEKNTTVHDNLGLARAETLKSIFVEKIAKKSKANVDQIKTQIRTFANQVDNLAFHPFASIDDKQGMHGGVNFLFTEGNASQDNGTSFKEDDSSDAKAEPTSLKLSSGDMAELAFFDFTSKGDITSKNKSFKEYYTSLRAYCKENNKDVIVTGYNNDKSVADQVSRTVRSYLKRKGFDKDGIKFIRETGKVVDSPSGKAGVSIMVK